MKKDVINHLRIPGDVLNSFRRQAAKVWWHSPEYQATLPPQTGSAISDVILIEPLPEGFTIKTVAASGAATLEDTEEQCR